MGVKQMKKYLERFLGAKEIKDSGIDKLTLALIPKMGVMSAVCMAVSLLITRDLREIPGFAAGYVYACFCLIYLARTCAKAAGCGDIKKAKAMMHRCYLLRFFGLFMLGAAALWFKILSFVGILVPQLFPKILLMFDRLSRKKD